MTLEAKPIPVLAETLAAPLRLRVTFDRGLTIGFLNVANWTMRFAGSRYGFIPVSAFGKRVTATAFGPAVPDPGPDDWSYTPPPFDRLSGQGVPADAFTDFPIP